MAPEGPAGITGWEGLSWEAFTRSRNAMVLLDGQRRQVEANGAYLQLLARPRAELIGRHAYEFLTDGPLVSSPEWRAALRRRQFTGVAELVRGDDRLVRVEFAGHPELMTGRQLILFVVLRTARGLRRLHDGSQEPTPQVILTRREVEVIEPIALGLSGTEIAHELHLTHNTVRTHTRNAKEARSALPRTARGQIPRRRGGVGRRSRLALWLCSVLTALRSTVWRLRGSAGVTVTGRTGVERRPGPRAEFCPAASGFPG